MTLSMAIIRPQHVVLEDTLALLDKHREEWRNKPQTEEVGDFLSSLADIRRELTRP